MKRKRGLAAYIARAVPHLTVILAVLLLVLFIIDRFNPNMAFLSHEIAKWFLAVLCVLAGTCGVLSIARTWRSDTRERRRNSLREGRRDSRE